MADEAEIYHVGAASMSKAIALFDALSPVAPRELRGLYHGAGFVTGHPMDGLLEACGWYGKEFVDEEKVHPLVFGDDAANLFRVNPSRLPFGLAQQPWVPKVSAMKIAFRAVRPIVAARGYHAHLETRDYRGKSSAAMVYNDLPIVDHFRKLDDHHLLGLMVLQGCPDPFFFRLASEP